MVVEMWRLCVVAVGGCELVFPLNASPLENCVAPTPQWSPAVPDDLSGTFDPSFQALASPTITTVGETQIMLYAAFDGTIEQVSYATFDNTENRFVNKGATTGGSMTKPSNRPQLWRTASGQLSMFFTGNEATNPAMPVPFEGVPGPNGELAGDWAVGKISLPASLTNRGLIHFGTPGLGGTRVVVEVDPTGEIIELERTDLNEYAELDTMRLVNGAGPAHNPRMSPDGCWVAFGQAASTGLPYDLMISVRQHEGTFGPPRLLADATPNIDERDPFVTEDLSRLYFSQVDLATPLILRRLYRRDRTP